MQEFFSRITDTWKQLGETEPFWSVLSSDQFKSENVGEHTSEFYDSGMQDVARLDAWLKRNRLTAGRRVCEYGCGVGRVTRYLAERFARVDAYDISASHLRLANSYLRNSGIKNVRLHLIRDPAALTLIPDTDMVFSFLVLQHNPPPVMAFILEKLLDSLCLGGLAFFQVPTHAEGYSFVADEYLRTKPNGIEMHVLSVEQVVEIAEKRDCRFVESQTEIHATLPSWIFHTFLLQKG